MTGSTRLKSIDALRGIAALAVVVFHADAIRTGLPPANRFFLPLFQVIWHGDLGVPLFFVVSGFCIHLPWARAYAATGKTDLNRLAFWRRRMLRLYPAYFAALCLTIAIVAVAFARHSPAPLAQYSGVRSVAADFLAHATMLHGLIPAFDRKGGNPVYWTLAREEYLYLLYMALLPLRVRFGLRPVIVGVGAVSLLSSLWVSANIVADSHWWAVLHYSALVLWIQWALGMVAVEASIGLIRLPGWLSSFRTVPAFAAAALITDKTAISPVCWGLTFFVVVNVCVSRELCPHGSVYKWLASVGVFSYSLYLVHYPVRGIVSALLRVPAVSSYDDTVVYLGTVVLAALCSYFAGKVFFTYVEQRWIRVRVRERSLSMVGVGR